MYGLENLIPVAAKQNQDKKYNNALRKRINV